MKADKSLTEGYPELSQMIEYYNKNQLTCWDHHVGEHLVLVETAPGRLVWEFEVQDQHCNQLGNIHGGCVATLIDFCTSFAILAHERRESWKTMGVSTDLSVSYILGVPAGETIRIECVVQRAGKNLANLHSTIYNSAGKPCYSGSHTKFNIASRL